MSSVLGGTGGPVTAVAARAAATALSATRRRRRRRRLCSATLVCPLAGRAAAAVAARRTRRRLPAPFRARPWQPRGVGAAACRVGAVWPRGCRDGPCSCRPRRRHGAQWTGPRQPVASRRFRHRPLPARVVAGGSPCGAFTAAIPVDNVGQAAAWPFLPWPPLPSSLTGRGGHGGGGAPRGTFRDGFDAAASAGAAPVVAIAATAVEFCLCHRAPHRMSRSEAAAAELAEELLWWGGKEDVGGWGGAAPVSRRREGRAARRHRRR